MKTIELEQYEINDLIRFLEYAKDQKFKDYKKKKMNLNQYNYEIGLIKDLEAKLPIKSIQQIKTRKEEKTLEIL